MDFLHTHLDTVDSTNRWLMDWANTHPARTHFVSCDTQTCGRGQHGRKWQDGGICASLYLPNDKLCAPFDGRLALGVGISLAKLLQVKVKWPNDLGMVKHGAFYKLGGILIEKAKDGVVIGVGLNRRTPAISCVPSYTMALEYPMTYANLAQTIAKPAPLNQFGDVDALHGHYVWAHGVCTTGQKFIHGCAHGIDNNGALLIDNTPLLAGQVRLVAQGFI